MSPRVILIVLAALLMQPLTPAASAAAGQEQEYQQVRTIALRDAKVRAAYEDANRRLEAKILQIDPALAPYVRTRMQEPPGVADASRDRRAHAKLTAFAVPSHEARTHVVTKGETLGEIAAKYGVSVAALKSSNQINDDRKLSVGRVLAIPTGQAPRKILE